MPICLIVVTPSHDRYQLISELQTMIQTLSNLEVKAELISRVPLSMVSLIRPISLEAVTSGMQTSLLIALAFTGICFLLATTLPKYPSH